MITRLEVHNFKSLRNVDISLGPLNVLIGPNMSGKSNILDALLFLYQLFFPQGGTQGVGYAVAQRGGIDEVLWKGGSDKLVRIAVDATDDREPDTKYAYSLELIAGTGGFASLQNESLTLIRAGGKIELLGKNTSGGLQYLNADGANMGGVQTGLSAMQYAYPGWDGFSFVESARYWRFYHFLPPIMKQSTEMASGQSLSPYGENISSRLLWLQTHSPKAFGMLNEVVRDVFRDVIQVRTIPTPDGKVHVSVDERGLKKSTNVWQLSDGFLHFVALLSLIYVPPELSGTLFLVEEPENYIHPKLLETLVALLRQVRQGLADAKQPLSQILLTTQSPYLVDQFELHEIVWIGKKEGETATSRPSEKKYLKELVENKERGLGDLMYAGSLGDAQ